MQGELHANWADQVQRAFNFSVRAREKFKKGSKAEKRRIYFGLGSNLTIKDRKVYCDLLKPFIKIAEGYKKLVNETVMDLTTNQPQYNPQSDTLGRQ